MGQPARQTMRVQEPSPFGDVTLAPATVTGRSQTELARAMANALDKAAPASTAEALSYLRGIFPDSPLTVRVAALAAMMRR